MDSSRRAVESYWRSRMIDGATSEEDKVTPVYKLEEICELLRSSPAGIVKEISDFVLKRLDHKSPVVKQKALRLIKFAVGKSGVEFRREMQRHSVAVRQLLHYRGKPDPLKGDALNKAVRETAQEALSAVFSNEDNKPAPAEDVKRRIEGFGNTNFVPPMEEKKSFLSEVVDLGSASIKQGLSTLTQGHSQKNRDNGSYGSYKGPTLRRSLTNEIDYTDKYEKMDRSGSNIGSYGSSNNITSQSWEQDSRQIKHETNGSSSSNSAYSESKTREERLLETIVTSGGVRLQPTRDALQAFLVEALKMDAVALCIALESKLHSPSWQVRMKAVCVLEAILRKSDYEHFAVVESFFNENIDIVVQCSESPQASLREKANKVLGLLGRAPAGATGSQSEKLAKSEPTEKIEMPNLIDTGGAEDLLKGDDPLNSLSDQNITQQSTASPPIDDLFGGGLSSSVETNEQKNDLFGGVLSNSVETIEQKSNDDPFADVSFHTSEDKEQGSSDLFAGMNVGNDSSTGVSLAKSTGSDPFDFLEVGSEVLLKQNNHNNEFENLMAGLSLGGNSSSVSNKAGDLGNGSTANGQPQSQHSNGKLESQTPTMTANTVFPVGPTPYNMAPGFMFNQPYPSTALNYGAMGGLLSQQQLIAAMANLQQLQQLGTLNSQTARVSFGSEASAGYSSAAFPDIFNANMPNQASAVTMNNSKKEETKAFDFISDHMAAARDTKRCS